MQRCSIELRGYKLNYQVLVFSVFCLVTLPLQALSAEFFTRSSEKPWEENGVQIGDVYLVGEIEIGDAQKLENIIKNGNSLGIYVFSLRLYSPGGLVSEGISIGKIARRYRLTTIAPVRRDSDPPYFANSTGDFICLKQNDYPSFAVEPENCICASSCALAWLGGIVRSGEVGLHRSYLGHDENEVNFGVMERTLNSSQETILAYLDEMRIPNWVGARILEASSQELNFISDDTSSISIDSIYDEFVISRCGGGYSEEEFSQLIMLQLKESDGIPLTLVEQIAVDSLIETVDNYWDCKRKAHLQAARESQTVSPRGASKP